jgi:hypothetical protein
VEIGNLAKDEEGVAFGYEPAQANQSESKGYARITEVQNNQTHSERTSVGEERSILSRMMCPGQAILTQATPSE